MVDDLDRPQAGVLVVAIPAASTAGFFASGTQVLGARNPQSDAETPGARNPPSDAETPGARNPPSGAGAQARPRGHGLAAQATPAAMVSTQADGRFLLPAVPPGLYILFAVQPGLPPVTSEALIVDRRALGVPLRLVIARGARLL